MSVKSVSLALGLGLIAAIPARASEVDCEPPVFAGRWAATSPVVRQLVRLEIDYACRAGRRVGESRIVYTYTMRVWSKCVPRDCPWGAAPVRRDDDGRLIADYAQFFSARTVTVEPAGLGLLARVVLDFYDEARPDEIYSQYLERE